MSEPTLSRRAVLLGIGGVAGVSYLRGRGGSPSGGATSIIDSSPRGNPIRPLLGGTWITPGDLSGYGSLGIGVEYFGDEAVVTNRHVVDKDSDEDPGDVVGRPVYQSSEVEEELIGPVEAASSIGGAGSSDWAVISVSTSSDWSTETIGLGSVSSDQDPKIGDRIVIDGASTGLLGGEITDVGVSANFRGELYTDLLQYTVDEDLDTAGNSGGLVARIDPDSGDVSPLGLHTFGFDDLKYAINWSDLPDSVELSTAGRTPEPPDTDAYVEGVIYDRDSSGVHIRASNLGGSAADRTVELLDQDGALIESTEISLGALSQEDLTLDATGHDSMILDVGQTQIETEIPE